MLLIKRYLNRKLYDTQSRRYITLEQIGSLIRQGTDIQVIDHKSGEDLTAITLAQVIAGQEKKQTGSVPSSALADLIASRIEGQLNRPGLPEEQIERLLKKKNIPSRLDIELLLSQLDNLNAKLDQLARSRH